MTTVITFGTYDLFHIGHLRLLKKCKKLGERLVVGVSTDALNYNKKKKFPVIDQYQRAEIIKALPFVDEVFFEESLEQKKEYIKRFSADILVMGDDWAGKFNDLESEDLLVVYVPRTKNISTTDIKQKIRND